MTNGCLGSFDPIGLRTVSVDASFLQAKSEIMGGFVDLPSSSSRCSAGLACAGLRGLGYEPID